MLVECDDSGASRIKKSIIPRVNVPSQAGRGNAIDVSVDAEISLTIDVDGVQGDEDRWVLPEFNRVELDFAALFWLRLVPRTDVHRVDRCAKNMLVIFWIGNPTNPCSVEDRVPPGLDIECESVHVDVSGSSFQTPDAVFVEVDAVEENQDLGRSGEGALKINTNRGWIIGICPEVARVFTSEEIKVTWCEGEHVHCGTVESGISHWGDFAVGGIFCDVLEYRCNADIGVVSDI